MMKEWIQLTYKLWVIRIQAIAKIYSTCGKHFHSICISLTHLLMEKGMFFPIFTVCKKRQTSRVRTFFNFAFFLQPVQPIRYPVSVACIQNAMSALRKRCVTEWTKFSQYTS